MRKSYDSGWDLVLRTLCPGRGVPRRLLLEDSRRGGRGFWARASRPRLPCVTQFPLQPITSVTTRHDPEVFTCELSGASVSPLLVLTGLLAGSGVAWAQTDEEDVIEIGGFRGRHRHPVQLRI